jgi:hypothetical protein
MQPLHSAPKGYPGQTPNPVGRYYRLAGSCTLSDTNGRDGQLLFRRAPAQKACLTRCAIAEGGQSGQPAFIRNGKSWTVLGTLSYGPETGTCYGYGACIIALDFMFWHYYACTHVSDECGVRGAVNQGRVLTVSFVTHRAPRRRLPPLCTPASRRHLRANNGAGFQLAERVRRLMMTLWAFWYICRWRTAGPCLGGLTCPTE